MPLALITSWKRTPPISGNNEKLKRFWTKLGIGSFQRNQAATVANNPISIAGVPPRKTMESTKAKKLPEIDKSLSTLVAVRSLRTEKLSRRANSPRSQLADGAATAPAASTTKRPATWLAATVLLGRSGPIWVDTAGLSHRFVFVFRKPSRHRRSGQMQDKAVY